MAEVVGRKPQRLAPLALEAVHLHGHLPEQRSIVSVKRSRVVSMAASFPREAMCGELEEYNSGEDNRASGAGN